MQRQVWQWIALGVVCFLSVACGNDRTQSPAPATSTADVAATPGQSPAPPIAGGTDQPVLLDVASVYNGAFAVDRSSVFDATRLLSGIKNHGDYLLLTNGTKGPDARSEFVIELAAPATLEKLRLIGPVNENYAPKRIKVALSDTPAENFEVIAEVDLDIIKNKDLYHNAFDVSLPVSVKRSGRFVRLEMSGSLTGDTTQNAHAMASFQAFGVFDQPPALRDISGIYHFQGDFGNDSSGGFYLILKQDGNWVEGCAVTAGSALPLRPERILNLVSGGVQDGVLHLERSDASGGNNASGIITFSSDKKFAHSAFFRKDSDPSLSGNVNRATGERVDTVPVACTTTGKPAQSAQQVWEETLEKEKVLRLYGVNFDLDSDVLRPESHTVLDKVVAIAGEKPEWVFEVAGHTDSSGPPAHNHDLSQRRAGSVVQYLSKAGIDPKRLVAKGYGADKPLMSNDTAAGMAQNRRVELVRQ